MARISGNEGMQQWPFWLDVEVILWAKHMLHFASCHVAEYKQSY